MERARGSTPKGAGCSPQDWSEGAKHTDSAHVGSQGLSAPRRRSVSSRRGVFRSPLRGRHPGPVQPRPPAPPAPYAASPALKFTNTKSRPAAALITMRQVFVLVQLPDYFLNATSKVKPVPLHFSSFSFFLPLRQKACPSQVSPYTHAPVRI